MQWRQGEEKNRMKRFAISMMVVGLGIGAGVGRASAGASPIATSMGDLHWGLSEHEVTAYARRKLTAQFSEEIAKTKDSGKQAKLKAELKKAQGEIEGSLTSFEGGRSRWDQSPVAGEFNYDNNESMLVAKGNGVGSYYFFLNGRLWKLVEVLDKSAGGSDFKKFSQHIEDKFGKGRLKKGELAPGQGNTQWLEYLDRNSRVRAADESSKRGGYAVIYEEMSTVRELASLHPKKQRKAADAEAEAAPAPAKEPPAQLAKAPTKRSIFTNENRTESDTDFQSRKQKTATEARDRAQRAHDRKEDAKKGEALKQLGGLNGSDPLGGL